MVESVTVNHAPDPCTVQYQTWYRNPTIVNRILLNMCDIEHTATSFVSDSAHWVWDELDSMWAAMENLFSRAGSSIGNPLHDAWEKARVAGGQVWNDLQSDAGKVLQWSEGVLSSLRSELGLVADRLYDEFGSVGRWLLLAGGLFLLYEFSPAINDSIAALTHGRRRE